jgi:hypothetical protein
MTRKFRTRTYFLIICVLIIFSSIISKAQILEPRQLTNIPVNINFALLGYGYVAGNILLDSSLPIEDLNANLHTVFGAYLRTINIFGMSGKIDVVVPYAKGDWRGILEGQDTSTARHGFGDPAARLSFNFIGAPALEMRQFKNYHQDFVAGASIQIYAPLGQYDPTKLLNLGTNRWTFRPQIGVSKAIDRFMIELYSSAWFYSTNDNFYGGNTLTQDPIYTVKTHLIFTFKNNMWLAVDFGYAFGGIAYLNGIERESKISTIRFGADWAYPLTRFQTVKVSIISAIRLERGSDFNGFTLNYQIRW